MQLDQEAINEFKELYFKEYGIRLSDEQAMDYGLKLINLIKAVYGNNRLFPSTIDRNFRK